MLVFERLVPGLGEARKPAPAARGEIGEGRMVCIDDGEAPSLKGSNAPASFVPVSSSRGCPAGKYSGGDPTLSGFELRELGFLYAGGGS
jgi:hypothetical protein